MIVLDTSVLSLAFRRRRRPAEAESPVVGALRALIAADAPLALPGIVLQELLSGVRSADQFRELLEALSGFPLLLADRKAHLQAARLQSDCRAAGIAASSIDCLIAAQALGRRRSLFTTDEDFARLAEVCALQLYRT